MSVLYVHNILWSPYKGAVFSELHLQAVAQNLKITFVQIAATAGNRRSLSEVDYSFHNYPYTLLFDQAYEDTTALGRAQKLISVLIQEKPSCVVLPGYDDPAVWALWLACLVSGKTRFIAFESTRSDHPRRKSKEWIKQLFVWGCNAGLCYGKRSAEYLTELGMNPARIYEPVQAVANSRMLVIAGKLEGELPELDAGLEAQAYFLFVGRLAPEKGLGTLLQAFSQFRMTNHSYKLCLVGDGAERAALGQMAIDLKLDDAIVFSGAKATAQLVSYYSNAYALVLPSLSEPWGLVVNEAFLMGCPALVSDRCGCIPELIIEGQTGYAFKADSVEALHGALLRIASDHPRRDQMGNDCRALIQNFSPEAAAAQMMIGFNAA